MLPRNARTGDIEDSIHIIHQQQPVPLLTISDEDVHQVDSGLFSVNKDTIVSNESIEVVAKLFSLYPSRTLRSTRCNASGYGSLY